MCHSQKDRQLFPYSLFQSFDFLLRSASHSSSQAEQSLCWSFGRRDQTFRGLCSLNRSPPHRATSRSVVDWRLDLSLLINTHTHICVRKTDWRNERQSRFPDKWKRKTRRWEQSKRSVIDQSGNGTESVVGQGVQTHAHEYKSHFWLNWVFQWFVCVSLFCLVEVNDLKWRFFRKNGLNPKQLNFNFLTLKKFWLSVRYTFASSKVKITFSTCINPWILVANRVGGSLWS